MVPNWERVPYNELQSARDSRSLVRGEVKEARRGDLDLLQAAVAAVALMTIALASGLRP